MYDTAAPETDLPINTLIPLRHRNSSHIIDSVRQKRYPSPTDILRRSPIQSILITKRNKTPRFSRVLNDILNWKFVVRDLGDEIQRWKLMVGISMIKKEKKMTLKTTKNPAPE